MQRFAALPKGTYILFGALILAVSTVLVGTHKPSNTLATSLLQSFTFLLSVYGSYVFVKATTGVVDPSLVQAARRNLSIVAYKAAEARVLAEGAYDNETRAGPKAIAGKISVHLSYIEDLAFSEVQNWTAVSGAASLGSEQGPREDE